MSPRSDEFLEAAKSQLGAARVTLEAGFPSAAISTAYYAMLYAARAALSERDRYAKTHSGVWGQFHKTFVTTGAFDEQLHQKAAAAQDLREAADYEAKVLPLKKAEQTLALAEKFVQAVSEMLDVDGE